MRLIFVFIFSSLWTISISQQDPTLGFTEKDFTSRKATKVKCLLTEIDTINNHKHSTILLKATFDPKTKIIKTSEELYYRTDTVTNEVYSVDENGKALRVNFTCEQRQLNDTTIKYCNNQIDFFSRKGQLIKTIDTNLTQKYIFETTFFYSGDTLKKNLHKISPMDNNKNIKKNDPDDPEEITETLYSKNKIIATRKILISPSKEIIVSKTITENNPSTIVTKIFVFNKLTSITTFTFK